MSYLNPKELKTIKNSLKAKSRQTHSDIGSSATLRSEFVSYGFRIFVEWFQRAVNRIVNALCG